MGKTKFIFVTGGVLSGVGKGITAASIGAVLQAKGVKVSVQKCDAYLNVDAGLLSPKEHGECFVTQDGAETDLDLGHYERFLDQELTQKNITLSGKILRDLIADERAGKFRGKTVQVVPHWTGYLRKAIYEAAEGDIHIVEIGGTVGDFESQSAIEAIREVALEVGQENCLFVHVVYVPFLEASQEYKTKPAQNALADLRSFGIMPNVVGVRTEGHTRAPKAIGDKIAMFSGVRREGIVMMPNVSSVYEVPITVARDLDDILSEFSGSSIEPDMKSWHRLAKRDEIDYVKELTVGIVAKYMNNTDAYLSAIEAIKSAAWYEKSEVNIRWIDAENVKEEELAEVDAVIVPSGFGPRGNEGMIKAADYCLSHNKPYLGIGLGMQTAVIAAAKRGGAPKASSQEFGSDGSENVIRYMDGQADRQVTGGTMRLGDHKAKLTSDSLVSRLYGADEVVERYRHRLEVDTEYIPAIEKGGLKVVGLSEDEKVVEFVESPENNFFVATQSHPEFKSRPFRPHPLFTGLVRAVFK